MRWSSSTIWGTLAMFSSVVAIFGRPERSSSPKLLQPRLNSAAHNFAEVNNGAESPNTESNSSLICSIVHMECIPERRTVKNTLCRHPASFARVDLNEETKIVCSAIIGDLA
ncbi:hypothetical protein TNCV_3199651 [Trichonephila clavipes]|nr:hypothetical protein TNCV_3199651 [Trichonephila clavipes]